MNTQITKDSYWGETVDVEEELKKLDGLLETVTPECKPDSDDRSVKNTSKNTSDKSISENVSAVGKPDAMNAEKLVQWIQSHNKQFEYDKSDHEKEMQQEYEQIRQIVSEYNKKCAQINKKKIEFYKEQCKSYQFLLMAIECSLKAAVSTKPDGSGI